MDGVTSTNMAPTDAVEMEVKSVDGENSKVEECGSADEKDKMEENSSFESESEEEEDEESESQEEESDGDDDPLHLLMDLTKKEFAQGRARRDPFDVDVVDALSNYVKKTKKSDPAVLNHASEALEESCSRYSARVDVVHDQLSNMVKQLDEMLSPSNYRNYNDKF